MLSAVGDRYARATSAHAPLAARWALAPLLPLAQVYGLGMRVRAALYASDVLKRRALPVRVISVGNLSVGGTGKTPLVIATANFLQESGRRVGVISRGYGRKEQNTIVQVSDGRSVVGDEAETGDEPLLIARRCPGVPVAVGADRYQAGQYLLDRCELDTLVLDDGYQHLALRRDIDILVLDASDRLADGCLLPRGRLREPLSAMARASLIMITRACHTNMVQPKIDLVRRVSPETPLCLTDFRAAGLWKVGGKDNESGGALSGQRVVAVSGIGNPSSFVTLLERAGAIVREHVVFRDHHGYRREDIQQIAAVAQRLQADRIVTTEKDAVKLNAFQDIGRQEIEMWAVRVDIEWLEGREQWERIVLQR